ncbi:unnamed protein product, partial [Cyprideis torosa]
MKSKLKLAFAMAKLCTEFAEGISMPPGFKKLSSNYDRCRMLLSMDEIANRKVIISTPHKDEAEAVKLIKEGETALR